MMEKEWTPARILHLAKASEVEYVVRACNAHDDLVAAIEQVLDDMGDTGLSCCQAAKDMLIAVLAKAGEK